MYYIIIHTDRVDAIKVIGGIDDHTEMHMLGIPGSSS